MAQDFEPWPGVAETVIKLTPGEQELKQRMFAAHATQQNVLTWFSVETERFRRPPDYDFTAPPNGGNILYERFDWGMTGARWLSLAEPALAELERK